MNQLQNLSEDEKNIIVEVIEALGIVKSGSKHLKVTNFKTKFLRENYRKPTTNSCQNGIQV